MSQAVKVGIFMTVVLAVLAYFLLKIEDLQLFAPEGQRIEVLFDSVAGLDAKAAVRVAGVRVGRVESIGLEGGRALVVLLLDRPVELTEGAGAAVANLGLLGDKYVLLEPGPPGAAPLPDGVRLQGRSPLSLDDAMERLNEVAGSIGDVTRSISGGGGETSVSRLLDNLEATSVMIRELVAANREQVSSTVASFDRLASSLADRLPILSDRLEGLLVEVDAVVGENRGDLNESLANIRGLTEGLEASVADLNEISGRLARGEGSIGKLLSSDEAHDQLVETLASVETGVQSLGEVFDRVKNLELRLGLESYYLEQQKDSGSAFTVELDPKGDRFYRFGLVSDPRGVTTTKTNVVTVTQPDGAVETTVIEDVKNEDKFAISAEVGVAKERWRMHGGLIQSTAGVGFDYRLFDRPIWLSLEAFDFSRTRLGVDLDPRLRLTGQFHLTPALYLIGGVDDVLLSDERSLFLGAGLSWRDDDLKYLLGSLPRFN